MQLFKLETLKLIGGTTIVLVALCIMLPGVMGYAFSLARLGLVILIAVVVSSALAFLIQVLLKRKKTESSDASSVSDEKSKTEDTSIPDASN
jgi:hypothetical protein